MNRNNPGGHCAYIFLLAIIVICTVCVFADEPSFAMQLEKKTGKVTIAVLSHTDFLPDATGVYDRRSWQGRRVAPGFVADKDLRSKNDEAYDNVRRHQAYDAEAVGLPEVLADAILEQLVKSKRFLPVERKSLRTAVLEQRFGKQIVSSYSDRTLDKAIQDMDKFEIGAGMAIPSVISGAWFNDLLHNFSELGTAVGARYLVLGNIHQLGSSVETKRVPLSERGRKVSKKVSEVRLRLRVIDTKSSTVVGADSLHLQVSSLFLRGVEKSKDDFRFMDIVAKKAANKILDIIFPARVVSVDPLVISRGSNDGVKIGDIFTIVREGKEIRESSGIVIAHLRSPVGQVKVADVQETVSVVSQQEGDAIVAGDFAVRPSPVQPSLVPDRSVSKKMSMSQQKLPRIAVGLVKAGSTAKTGCDAARHIPVFTDTIISRLVQSKRFTIIDRQEIDQLLDEQVAQALAEDRDLPTAMGTLKGCDYLMIGALQNFSMEERTIRLPNSSRVMKMRDGFAEGNIRLVDAKSGEIIESRKISVKKQLEIHASKDRLIASLADQFASKVVANILNAIYPIKIASVTDEGKVYVNRGEDGMMQLGAMYDVFHSGQKIIDPDTGQDIGTAEEQIGRIKLTAVEDNRSVGRIIEGMKIQSGDILRPVDAGGSRTVGREETSRPGTSPKVASSVDGGSITIQHERGKRLTIALTKIRLNARKKFDSNLKVSVVQKGTMDQLTDNLADALSKTHRFTIIERSGIDRIIDEKLFNAISDGQDIRGYLKELKGADYIVLGEMTNFYLYIQKRKVPYVDKIEITSTGFAEGNIRVVDSHTGKVIATDKIRIKKEFEDIGLEEIRTKLIDFYSARAASGIVRRMYPVKILAVMSDGAIFLNRGKDAGLKVGDIFSVERPGPALIDSDTGISFGVAETPVGMLAITSVEAYRSRGRMTSGGPAATGDILREHHASASQPEKPEKISVPW